MLTEGEQGTPWSDTGQHRDERPRAHVLARSRLASWLAVFYGIVVLVHLTFTARASLLRQQTRQHLGTAKSLGETAGTGHITRSVKVPAVFDVDPVQAQLVVGAGFTHVYLARDA